LTLSSTFVVRRRTIGPSIATLLTVLVFGLAGLTVGLRQIAVSVLKVIVTSDSSLTFQELSDVLPVPHKLDWSVPLMQFLTTLREMRGPFLIIMTVLLLVVVGAVFTLIVLFESPPPTETNTTLTATGIVPRTYPGAEPVSVVTAFQVDEVLAEHADPTDSPISNDVEAAQEPKRGRRLPWVLPVLLYAVSLPMLLYLGAPTVSDAVLTYYRTLGTFNKEYFAQIAVPSVMSCVVIWSAMGLALNCLCVRRRSVKMRAAVGVLSIALFGVAMAFRHAVPAHTMDSRRDWTDATLQAIPTRSVFGVPDGVRAARLLAKQTNLTFGDRPEQTLRPLVMLQPDGIFNVRQTGYTEDGLTASPSTAKPVKAFLGRRHYETALSWIAIKHLFNVATVHFDTTAAIDACMTDMEECPHMNQCGSTTRAMLFICGASPANLALVRRWADEDRFTHPTRDSRRLMGQLFERFGQPEEALAWYRRADMPASFIARVRNEKPLFHAGRITGKLILDGKPLAGMQVGVVPRRLNGLPPDLEPTVLGARLELMAFRSYKMFAPHYLRPYALRWISASSVTDANGRFDISNLTEGEYVLVFSLPTTVQLDPPVDPHLSVSRLPPPLILKYKVPTQDIGELRMSIRTAPRIETPPPAANKR